MIISYDVTDVTQLNYKLESCLSLIVQGMRFGISRLSQLAVFDLNSMLHAADHDLLTVQTRIEMY